MDERKKNMLKAASCMVLTIGVMMGLTLVFFLPIDQYNREKIIAENCPDGLEDCGLIIEPSPIYMMLGIPGVIVYVIVFNHLEKNRFKTWRSFN